MAAKKRNGNDEPLFYVVVCSDTQGNGFGCLAGPKGWVRPLATEGGWLLFASSGIAFQWAANNIGIGKEWTVSPLFSRIAVAAAF